MVEGACLENRFACERNGGSNPSLTAVKVDNQPIKRFAHKPTHIKAKFVRIFIYEIKACKRFSGRVQQYSFGPYLSICLGIKKDIPVWAEMPLNGSFNSANAVNHYFLLQIYGLFLIHQYY